MLVLDAPVLGELPGRPGTDALMANDARLRPAAVALGVGRPDAHAVAVPVEAGERRLVPVTVVASDSLKLLAQADEPLRSSISTCSR